ncbi:unnamed protein product [Prunus armeniaca]
MSCVDALFERVNLERSVESSAGEKARTFGVGRTCRRQGGRSSRQASDTGVVPAEGSPMLKSAICGHFGRITGSGNESFAQSFDVGLCASCYGGDTCLWRLGSTVESFGSRELRQVPAASKEYLPLARKKRQSEPPALDIVVRIDLFILHRASAQSRRNRGIGPEIRQVIPEPESESEHREDEGSRGGGLLVWARKRPDRHVQNEPRGLGPEPVGGPRHSRQVASNRFTLSIPGRVAAFRSGVTPGTAGLCWLIKMDLRFTLTESPRQGVLEMRGRVENRREATYQGS